MPYHLKIAKGTVKTEEGFFFKALPFTIESIGERTEAIVLQVRFERGTTGKVVFKIIENKKAISECQHPDYIPELPLTQNITHSGTEDLQKILPPSLQIAMSALTYLKITLGENYIKTFHPQQGGQDLSFSVHQSLAT